MRFQVDLEKINHEDFDVSERPNGTLITPKKSKHVWTEDELHLRSLIVDERGFVVSSGFPKFRNYGENPDDDRAFENALAANRTSIVEKMDGSLVIISVNNGLITHKRTRGSHELGEFAEHVLPLFLHKYEGSAKGIMEFCPGMDYSVLFEFVSPDKQIIVKYPEPDLRLLAIVWHSNLVVSNSEDHLARLSSLTGIPVAPRYSFYADDPSVSAHDVFVNQIRQWPDKEGVVVSFYHGDNLKLIKVKADTYCRLHSIRFRTEGKGGKLAYLLGIESPDEILPKLASIGIDYEGAEYVRPEIEEYLTSMENVRIHFEEFSNLCGLTKWEVREDVKKDESVPEVRKNAEIRKRYVAEMLRITGEYGHYTGWFSEAMLIFDDKFDEAWLYFVASILDESPQAVRNWGKTNELSRMLKAPVLEDA